MDRGLSESVSVSETMAGFAANEDLAERALAPDLSCQPLPESIHGATHSPSSPVSNSSDPRFGTCQELPIGGGDFGEEFFWNHLVSDKDYLKYPVGWARLAAYCDQFNNADSFRCFRYPIVRLIFHTGGRCVFLENYLRQYEEKHTSHLRGLTENQKRLPGQPRIPDEYQDILDELRQAIVEYIKLLSCYKAARQLHPVPQARQSNIIRMILAEKMLDKEGCMLFDSPDDLSTVSEPLLPGVFVNFMHSRFGAMFLDMLSTTDSDMRSRLLARGTAEFLLKFSLFLIEAVLLIIPLGFLYLGTLNKNQSFGLITGFTLLFSMVMMLSREGDIHKTLVGVCAYCAVLFTISVQVSGGSP